MIKKIKVLSMAFLVAMSLASCSKSKKGEKTRIIEGGLISVNIKEIIKTESGISGYVYVIQMDAIKDGDRMATAIIFVDSVSFLQCMERMKGWPQPQFARFQSSGNSPYILKEWATVKYDGKGIHPFYIFESDHKTISN